MAFLPPQDQNQYAPQGTTTANPQANTGGSGNPPPQSGGSTGAGTVSGTSQSAGTPSSGSPTQFGSSASKLGDYLTANAPQIQGQANTVARGLNTAYGQVGQDINNAANQFGQSVAAGYVAPNQDVVNQAAANPAGFASNPNNVSAFQGQYNDTYSGPTSYESTTPYGAIQNEVTNAVTDAGLFNTQAGLQNYFAGQGGNQTQASNTLDSLLLQGNPQAQQTIETAANQFNNLTPTFNNSVTAADQDVTAAQQAAQQAQQYAQARINPVVQNFGNTLNTDLTNAQNNTMAYNNALNQFYTQATPIEQQINQTVGSLNGTPQTITDLFAPVIANNKLVSTPPTLASVATNPQYQEAAALQQLIGQGYQSPLNQANINQAGTAVTPNANLPTIQSLLQQYKQPLAQDFANAFPNGAGWGPAQAANWVSEGNLAKYLNQYDPADYSATPGSLDGFGSVTI